MLERFKCFDLRDFFRLEISFEMLKLRQISNFSQIQKRSNCQGEGGQENCGLFPLFVKFFVWDPSLSPIWSLSSTISSTTIHSNIVINPVSDLDIGHLYKNCVEIILKQKMWAIKQYFYIGKWS